MQQLGRNPPGAALPLRRALTGRDHGPEMAGLLLLFTIPVNLVMGQQLVPSQAGYAEFGEPTMAPSAT